MNAWAWSYFNESRNIEADLITADFQSGFVRNNFSQNLLAAVSIDAN